MGESHSPVFAEDPNGSRKAEVARSQAKAGRRGNQLSAVARACPERDNLVVDEGRSRAPTKQSIQMELNGGIDGGKRFIS
jgi:hypothetical protein